MFLTQNFFGIQNLFWPKFCFDQKFSLEKSFLGPKIFWTKFFWTKIFLDKNPFLDQHFYGPNIFLTKKYLGPFILGGTKLSLNPKNMGTQISWHWLFLNQELFWNRWKSKFWFSYISLFPNIRDLNFVRSKIGLPIPDYEIQ